MDKDKKINNFSIGNIKIEYWAVFILMVFSSLLNFNLDGKYLFRVLMEVFCIVMAVRTFKIPYFKEVEVNLLFLGGLLSIVTTYYYQIQYSYKHAAVGLAYVSLLIYFSAAYIYKMTRENKKVLDYFVMGIKVMIIIQLLWIPLQYVLYHFAEIDINKIIFLDILQSGEKLNRVSFYRSGVYYPSGLTWHSAVLAPMFVIAIILFENFYVRSLIILDAFLCGNSTAIIGVGITFVLWFLFKIKDGYRLKDVKKSTWIGIVVVMAAAALLSFKVDVIGIFLDKILYLIRRLTNVNSDSSTMHHLRYYTKYFEVCKNTGLGQIIFGYGLGCSGLPFSYFYGQYVRLANWVVESDIMDILYSRGIFGFIFYYYFLFKVCIKGYKVDWRYTVIMIAFLIQGFAYNIQFEYILLFELVMYVTIQLNINIFEYGKCKSFFKKDEKEEEKRVECETGIDA